MFLGKKYLPWYPFLGPLHLVLQKAGFRAKNRDFSKKPGFQGHFSWISSWAPTGGWNCKKVGFQTPVKTSFFARNPYFLHEIQVFCKTRWQKTWISGCTQWAPTEIQVFCPWAAEIQDFCWNPAFLHQIQLFCKVDEEASGWKRRRNQSFQRSFMFWNRPATNEPMILVM